MKFRSRLERHEKIGTGKIIFGFVGIIISILSYNSNSYDDKLPSYMTESYSPKMDSLLVVMGNSGIYQKLLLAAKKDPNVDSYYKGILNTKEISKLDIQKLEVLS